MAYDLRGKPGDVSHADGAQGSSLGPGRRSAVGELEASDLSPGGKSSRPGGGNQSLFAGPADGEGQEGKDAKLGLGQGGGRQPLFAGAVEWEDIHDEDPLAQAAAQQPAADEEGDAGTANEDGELDVDSEGGDEEALAEPAAPEARASEPGQAAAPQAPSGGAVQAKASSPGDRAPREAPQPASASAASTSKTYHVNREYKDGPYAGTAKYDVRVTAKDITMTVGIKLTPSKGVSAAQVTQVKNASQAIFKQKYDRRFKLTEIPYKPRPLRVKLRFSSTNAHHNVALHKGEGRDNAANWFVKGDNTTRAHEVGHLLGLKDEYADKASPKRKVHTDNSLMGNYYAEGLKTAKLKKRHGKVFASDISRASGRKFYLSL